MALCMGRLVCACVLHGTLCSSTLQIENNVNAGWDANPAFSAVANTHTHTDLLDIHGVMCASSHTKAHCDTVQNDG